MGSRKRLRAGLTVAGLAACLVGAPVAVADDAAGTRRDVCVTLTDLGVLGHGARAQQITDSGVVIGSFSNGTGSRAFRWVDGVMTDLPGLGGENTGASDVNERGQVVGFSNTDGSESHAVLWQPDGTVVDLGTRGVSSQATGINRLGVVAGNSIRQDGQVRAVIWRAGLMTDLGDLGGGWSNTALPGPSINDLGEVAGTSVDVAGVERAYRWSDGAMSALPPPPGLPPSSFARAIARTGQVLGSVDGGAIGVVWDEADAHAVRGLGGSFVVPLDMSDRGDVVGFAETATGAVHAFVATDDSRVDLGTLGGRNSEATAVNRRGLVVGDSAVGPDPFALHAVAWNEGEAIDLATLDGGTSSQALDINRRGEIVGWSLDEHGVEHAVMWTLDC